jgi:hypothetical protein
MVVACKFDGPDCPPMPATSRERATGVMPNSPAMAIISSSAAAAILTRGFAHGFPSADLTMRPCVTASRERICANASEAARQRS